MDSKKKKTEITDVENFSSSYIFAQPLHMTHVVSFLAIFCFSLSLERYYTYTPMNMMLYTCYPTLNSILLLSIETTAMN